MSKGEKGFTFTRLRITKECAVESHLNFIKTDQAQGWPRMDTRKPIKYHTQRTNG